MFRKWKVVSRLLSRCYCARDESVDFIVSQYQQSFCDIGIRSDNLRGTMVIQITDFKF